MGFECSFLLGIEIIRKIAIMSSEVYLCDVVVVRFPHVDRDEFNVFFNHFMDAFEILG